MDQKRKKIPQFNMDSRGITLMELVVTVAIIGILVGLVTVSANAIPNYRATKAAESVGAALDRIRTEASNRLVAEMKLEYRSGEGYYITYYLDRGKVGSQISVSGQDTEKIAPAGLTISYTDSNGTEHDLKEAGSLILTIDRASGAFRPIQTQVTDQENILASLNSGQDITFFDSSVYCSCITVKGGSRTNRIELDQYGGTYSVTAG